MTIIIDGPRSLALLHEATALRGPDFRYFELFTGSSGCSYAATPDGGDEVVAACMIGLALQCAGVSVEQLRQLTGSIANIANWRSLTDADTASIDHPHDFLAEMEEVLLSVLTDVADVVLSEQAVRIWWAAQRAQDDGKTWGQAVAFAGNVAALTQLEVVR